MNIPRHLTVPPMPEKMDEDAQIQDITIDSLIRLLEICKQEVGGDEMVLFRDSRESEIFTPAYPILTVENSYDPVDGEWVCRRAIIDVRKL